MIQASLDVKGKFYVSEPVSPDTPEWRVNFRRSLAYTPGGSLHP